MFRNLFIVVLMFFLIFNVVHADSNGIWTQAKDIRAGTFGGDEGGGDFVFPGKVSVSNKAVINGNEDVLQIVGNDHGYIEFYPQGKSSGRESWIGFGSTGDKEFTIQDSSNLLLNPYGGDVGIGTSNPQEKLDVTGNIAGTNIYSSGKIGIGTINPLSKLDVSGNIRGNDVYSSGKIGIGTMSPQKRFHLSYYDNTLGGDNAALLVENTATNNKATSGIEIRTRGESASGIQFSKNAFSSGNLDSSAFVYHHDRDEFGIWTSASSGEWSPKIVIEDKGDIGIGTTNPQQKLDVRGDVSADNIYSNGKLVATKQYVDNSGGATLGDTYWTSKEYILKQNDPIFECASGYVVKAVQTFEGNNDYDVDSMRIKCIRIS